MSTELRELLICGLLAKFDEGCALAALLLASFGEGGDMGVRFEELAKSAS